MTAEQTEDWNQLIPEHMFPTAKKTLWRYEGGEISLSLFCSDTETIDGSFAFFEMARVINDEALVGLLKSPADRQEALEAIERGDDFMDPFWTGFSTEELEKFCEERMLPLPPNYQSAWARAIAEL